MNTTEKGLNIIADKDKIIRQYRDNVRVTSIAKYYGVVESTIYLHLKNWGIPLRHGAWVKKAIPRKHYKVKKSAELLARIAENTAINDKKIKYVEFKETTEDQILVRNIIRHPLFY